MKIKPVVFEFALAILSLLIALATGISQSGKPLRLVDAVIILALGIAGIAALTKAIISLRKERRRMPDDGGREA